MIAEVRKAKFEDARAIAATMRVSVAEVDRLGDKKVELLEEAILRATYSWAGFLDGKIVCLWGVRTDSLMSDTAFLWLITTSAVAEHPFHFVRRNQIFIKELSKRYRVIHGYVDARFVRSLAWLKWLGFTIDPPKNRVRYFHMERD